MKNEKCIKIRERLQQAHDQREKLNKEITIHIMKCPECKDFSQYLSTFPSLLKSTINKAIAPMPAPDFNAVFKNAQNKKSRPKRGLKIISLAASVLIVLGSIFVYNIIDVYQTNVLVQEETHYFVEELFSTPLMQGVEYQAMNAIDIPLD